MLGRLTWLLVGLFGLGGLLAGPEDAGLEPIGRIGVTLVFGTNGDPAAAGQRARPLAGEVAARLQKSAALNFSNYRVLGEEIQPILRGVENWGVPMRPNEEVRVRFDVEGREPGGGMRLDLELWLQKQKVLKSSASLEPGRPMYIRGPAWRGGQMILIIELKR